MRAQFDFSPFRRSSIGFDRLFDLLENGPSLISAEGYPPFDIEQDGADTYRITMAVAGFRQDEIDITVHQNLLIVRGRKADGDGRNYIHRGIGAREFERRFALGDYVQVRGASLEDGLLTVDLVREVPEEMKPRRIEIGGSGPQALSDQRPQNDNEGNRRAA